MTCGGLLVISILSSFCVQFFIVSVTERIRGLKFLCDAILLLYSLQQGLIALLALYCVLLLTLK